MRRIDEQYLKTPFYGSRRMTVWLTRRGVRSEPQTCSAIDAADGHRGDLSSTTDDGKRHRNTGNSRTMLRGLEITKSGPGVGRGHHVHPDGEGVHVPGGDHRLAQRATWWRGDLSNSLESSFCVDVLKEALSQRQPEIFNTDQGVQFTCREFTRPVGGGGGEDQHGTEKGARWTTCSWSGCGGA